MTTDIDIQAQAAELLAQLERLKVCSACLKAKDSENDFYADKRNRSGRQAECKSCTKKRTTAYGRRRGSEFHHAKNLRYKSGISIEQYNEMLVKQDHRCAICRLPDQYGYRLAVDHDHSCCPGRKSCGKCVRGLLCRKCNTAIGLLDESRAHLEAAIAYLDHAKKGD